MSNVLKSVFPHVHGLVHSMFDPGILCLLETPLEDSLHVAQLPCSQASGRPDGNLRRQPSLRLPVGMRNVDMNAGLLTGEEEQAELPVAYHRGCHHAM